MRGEWGIERPRSTVSPVRTSTTTPPWALLDRQPPTVSVSPSAVTYRGWPFSIARPFKWQRSSGTISLMNGGFQRGRKLYVSLTVHRQENRELTIHRSP